ncbi:MAG: ImmA/IrrE family metallo-endopeptidase [Candidatus Marinimicrobia bacterium]|nr:ImmA/IrrE family metallo-endopeptidase [Candidatus Neomarinimicrobiota bacterium]
MNSIMAPRLSNKEIREKADNFREEYASNILPVPIIDILEIDLKIDIYLIHGMLSEIDIDGFLSKDLSRIYIDRKIYEDDRYINRLRFTFAHEIGHFVLHKDIIESCKFRNGEEWKQFRNDFREDTLSIIEQQAYEFAGRLLVPKNKLIKRIPRGLPRGQRQERLKTRGFQNTYKSVYCVYERACI